MNMPAFQISGVSGLYHQLLIGRPFIPYTSWICLSRSDHCRHARQQFLGFRQVAAPYHGNNMPRSQPDPCCARCDSLTCLPVCFRWISIHWDTAWMSRGLGTGVDIPLHPWPAVYYCVCSGVASPQAMASKFPSLLN